MILKLSQMLGEFLSGDDLSKFGCEQLQTFADEWKLYIGSQLWNIGMWKSIQKSFKISAISLKILSLPEFY